MSAQVNLNIDELKDFIKHIVDNNRFLQNSGKNPVSIEVVGDSGIGKTSTILQLADELNLNCVKLNLAQIEELGDLVGFPIRQFEMCTESNCIWVDEHAVEEYSKTVLNALSETESALASLRSVEKQIGYSQNAINELKNNITLTHKQIKVGTSNSFVLIRKQRDLLKNEMNLINLELQNRIERINLYMALGAENLISL